MDLKVNISLPTELKSESIFFDALNEARDKIMNKMIKTVKEEHRYNHQTRKLRNATYAKSSVTPGELLNIEVGVKESKAPYAKHIIDGHGTWQPDPYLKDALDNTEDFIQKQLELAVKKAVDEFNRRK
jgi:ATP-dependent protease HslVU (ClpYQ) ATPase subunit